MDPKESNEQKLKEFADKIEGVTPPKATVTPIGTPIQDTGDVPKPWQRNPEQVQMINQIGWQKIPIKDLPTQGLFYPEGAEVNIRAATAAEIRHWSTLNENDLSALDDMLNYIIERCSNMKCIGKMASWRDLKEVDRFYILLAIRELTFVEGENKLQVKTSETTKIDVTKDMIDYITFDDRLMKYYSPEERLFVLKFKTGKQLKVTIPSVGVTNWLKNYINRKRMNNEVIDEDYISFAPFVILDWRGLGDDSYTKLVMDSQGWTTAEISILTEIRKIFIDTVNPFVKYNDSEGGERVVPLNFQGGFKYLLLVSSPFDQLV